MLLENQPNPSPIVWVWDGRRLDQFFGARRGKRFSLCPHRMGLTVADERCTTFEDGVDCEFAATMVCQSHGKVPMYLCDSHAGRHNRYCDAKLTAIAYYTSRRDRNAMVTRSRVIRSGEVARA